MDLTQLNVAIYWGKPQESWDNTMTYNRRLLNKLNLAGKAGYAATDASADGAADMMSNPDYLRQSSSLINEALQKGFDVLQLANGANRLVRSKAKSTTRRASKSGSVRFPSLEEEGEDA
jgi:hypothetical protein